MVCKSVERIGKTADELSSRAKELLALFEKISTWPTEDVVRTPGDDGTLVVHIHPRSWTEAEMTCAVALAKELYDHGELMVAEARARLKETLRGVLERQAKAKVDDDMMRVIRRFRAKRRAILKGHGKRLHPVRG